MRDQGYGVFLAVGLLLALGAGITMSEPSAGAVIGLGIGAVAALALRLLRRN